MIGQGDDEEVSGKIGRYESGRAGFRLSFLATHGVVSREIGRELQCGAIREVL